MPASHGAADVDKLFELRGGRLDGIEQVTAGVDVQADRLVHVVLGFTAGNQDLAVLDYGVTLGDPSEDDVWHALAANLARPFAALPIWTTLSGRADHLWDASCLAIHARHYRPLSNSRRRRLRLVAV